MSEEALAIQSTLTPVEGVTLLAGYPVAMKVDPRPEHYDTQGHLNNVAAIRIFQDIRVIYMRDRVGRRRLNLLPREYVIGVRELVTSYLTEARPGEQLYAGCRVLGRSRRSWCFDEVITTADRVVARLRLIECAISEGKAIEVPAALWAAVEAVEGRDLPVRELPVGRTPWDVT